MPTTKTTYKTQKRKTNYGSRSGTSGSTGSAGSAGSSTGSWNPHSFSPARFSNTGKEIQARIGSFRNINSQLSGAGKVTAFSPTTVNKWIKFVNNGTRVYKFKNNDFCKYFGSNWSSSNPTAAQRWLTQKFGTGIKAVTRGKANCWLIAATNNVTGRPFTNYSWK